MKQIILEFWKLISAREYGIGDEVPKHLMYSKLEALDVYKAKKTIKIIDIIIFKMTGKKSINKYE